MSAPAEEDFTKVALQDRIVHKSWKARVSAYEELAAIFARLDPDVDGPKYQQWTEFLKKATVDTNAAAQESALAMVLAFVQNAPLQTAQRARPLVMPGIVDKCLAASRTGSRTKAVEIVQMLVEVECGQQVLDDLTTGINHKTPKFVSATVAAIRETIDAFGPEIVNVKPIMKLLPKVFEHKDKAVRAEGQLLAISIYKWIGEAINSFLTDLKPIQQKELNEQFKKLVREPMRPQRLVRSAQEKMKKGGSGADGDTGDDGIVMAFDQPKDVDPYDLLDAVPVLNKLPTDFYKNVISTKWKERKDALEGLLEVVKSPKLEDDKYHELVSVLGKRIPDINIVCALTAANCIENMAKGLRSAFAPYRSLFMHQTLDRLKEKKQNLLEALRNELDAVFLSIANFEPLLEDIAYGTKNKNPQGRAETFSWVVRCLNVYRGTIDKKVVAKPIAELAVKGFSDSDSSVRDRASEVLGTLMTIIGERSMVPYMEQLDKIKQKKIQEFANNIKKEAEVKKKELETKAASDAAAKEDAKKVTAVEPTQVAPKIEEPIKKSNAAFTIDFGNTNTQEKEQETKTEPEPEPEKEKTNAAFTIDFGTSDNSNKKENAGNMNIVDKGLVNMETGPVEQMQVAQAAEEEPTRPAKAEPLALEISFDSGPPKRRGKPVLSSSFRTFKKRAASNKNEDTSDKPKASESSEKIEEKKKDDDGASAEPAKKGISITITGTEEATAGSESSSSTPMPTPTVTEPVSKNDSATSLGPESNKKSPLEKTPVKMEFSSSTDSGMNMDVDMEHKKRLKTHISPSTSHQPKSLENLPNSFFVTSKAALKEQRCTQDKLRPSRWVFETPGRDIIDYLRDQCLPVFDAQVVLKMFSEDHFKEKEHVDILNAMSYPILRGPKGPHIEEVAMNYNMTAKELREAYIRNSDLLIKYITIRFFDKQTSIFLATLDLLEQLLTVMDEEGYKLSEYEASILLPYFVNKFGESKEAIKSRIKDITGQMTRLYPASKMFGYILKATESKNGKIRVACLTNLTTLVQRNGISVCNPMGKTLPHVAELVADRDSSVRSAALGFLAIIYSLIDTQIWNHLGDKISSRDKSFIEERFKRTALSPSSQKPRLAHLEQFKAPSEPVKEVIEQRIVVEEQTQIQEIQLPIQNEQATLEEQPQTQPEPKTLEVAMDPEVVMHTSVPNSPSSQMNISLTPAKKDIRTQQQLSPSPSGLRLPTTSSPLPSSRSRSTNIQIPQLSAIRTSQTNTPTRSKSPASSRIGKLNTVEKPDAISFFESPNVNGNNSSIMEQLRQRPSMTSKRAMQGPVLPDFATNDIVFDANVMQDLINKIMGEDINVGINSLKKLETLLTNSPEQLVPYVNVIVSTLTTQLNVVCCVMADTANECGASNIQDQRKQVALQQKNPQQRVDLSNVDVELIMELSQIERLLRHVISAFVLLFTSPITAKNTKPANLKTCMMEILIRLVDPVIYTIMEEGEQVSSALNILIVRILNNVDRKFTFQLLIGELDQSVNESFNLKEQSQNISQQSKYTELVMKCLWKLTKSIDA